MRVPKRWGDQATSARSGAPCVGLFRRDEAAKLHRHLLHEVAVSLQQDNQTDGFEEHLFAQTNEGRRVFRHEPAAILHRRQLIHRDAPLAAHCSYSRSSRFQRPAEKQMACDVRHGAHVTATAARQEKRTAMTRCRVLEIAPAQLGSSAMGNCCRMRMHLT